MSLSTDPDLGLMVNGEGAVGRTNAESLIGQLHDALTGHIDSRVKTNKWLWFRIGGPQGHHLPSI